MTKFICLGSKYLKKCLNPQGDVPSLASHPNPFLPSSGGGTPARSLDSSSWKPRGHPTPTRTPKYNPPQKPAAGNNY